MNHLIFFLSVGAKGAWAPRVDDRKVRDRRTGGKTWQRGLFEAASGRVAKSRACDSGGKKCGRETHTLRWDHKLSG